MNLSSISANLYSSTTGIPAFAVYFVVAAAMFYLAALVYERMTPYREMELIRGGNVAAAVSFAGAMLGLAMPIANAIVQSHSVLDMCVWALVGIVVQLSCWLAVRRLVPTLPSDIPEGKLSVAILLASIHVAVGILNAASITY